MATLQDLVDKVAAETTLITGVKAFIDGLKAQIAAIPGITPEQQAQIDTIFDGMQANAASLSAAIVVNTPPVVTPPVIPPVVEPPVTPPTT